MRSLILLLKERKVQNYDIDALHLYPSMVYISSFLNGGFFVYSPEKIGARLLGS